MNGGFGAFLRDQRGAAIVELAFVAPIIGGIAAVSYGIWDMASRQQDMRAAVRVAAEYYMNGGGDDGVAVDAAERAWRNAPADATVTPTRVYRCGAVEVLSTQLCAGGVAPSVYVRLDAAGTEPGAMISPRLTTERTVRVR